MTLHDAAVPSIGRRDLLAAGAAALACGALPSSMAPRRAAARPPSDIRFRVLRGGSEIGTHTIAFRSAGDGWSAHTSIDLQVRVAFITAFRFVHDSEETWRDDALTSLRSQTNNNGTQYEVTGAAVVDGFRVVGPGGPLVVPSGLLTSNGLWDPRFTTQSRLISAQEGGEIGLSIRRVGEETASGAAGMDSTKFRMVTPQIGGYLWYDRSDHWVRAVLEIRGETLTYEPV
jgi:Family of unknown function (DUF6134)